MPRLALSRGSRLNESPELIAQEFCHVYVFRGEIGRLNESPELIAQECAHAPRFPHRVAASMKVLSLLLRNDTPADGQRRFNMPQ